MSVENPTLQDRLEAIRHDRLDLSDQCRNAECHPHRPELGVWAGWDEDDGEHVVLSVDALWGQSRRFVELSPSKARTLAHKLLQMADKVEAEVAHEPA